MSGPPRCIDRTLAVALCLVAAGCGGNQSALDPAGPGAARIGELWWLMLAVCAAVLALVTLMLLWALARRGRPPGATGSSLVQPDPRRERRMGQVVGAAVGATAAIVLLFVVASHWIGRELVAEPADPALSIEVTAQRWWWDVRYQDPVPSRGFSTANEITSRSAGRSGSPCGPWT